MFDSKIIFPTLTQDAKDPTFLRILSVGLDVEPVALTCPDGTQATQYSAAQFSTQGGSTETDGAIGVSGADLVDLVTLRPLGDAGATVMATRPMALFRLVTSGDLQKHCKALVVSCDHVSDALLRALATLPRQVTQVAVLLSSDTQDATASLQKVAAVTSAWTVAEPLLGLSGFEGLRLVRKAAPALAVPQAAQLVAAAPHTGAVAVSTMIIATSQLDEAEISGTLTAIETVHAPLPQVIAYSGDVPIAVAPVQQGKDGVLTFCMEVPRDVLFDGTVSEIILRVGQAAPAGNAVSVAMPKRRLLSAERLLAFDRPDAQSDKPARKPFGIVLYSFTRTEAAMLVLESLKRQGALHLVEIWMDGDQGKPDVKKALEVAEAQFREFGVQKITRHRGNLGFRKMIIQSLMYMVDTYDRFIVLEDDCFPSGVAVEEFTRSLDAHADTPNVLTTYGHHFLIENEFPYCPRFQGWGWATYSDRFRPFLMELAYLFSLSESAYLEWTHSVLTPEIIAKIDATAPRGASITVQRFFAWDETLALISALAGAVHAPTERRCVYNFGVGGDSTHFSNIDWYRKPPFNMVLKSEVWDHF
jgi:hypothetical protein